MARQQHTSAEREKRFRLGLFGDTRSGKTVYLTALDWLAKEGPMPERVSMRPGTPETAHYLGQRVAALRAGEWPPGNIDDTDLSLLIDHGRRTLLVRTTDFRGGDFQTAMYSGSETEYREFARRLFGGCGAYVFLLDPAQIKASEEPRASFAAQGVREGATSAIVVALEELRKNALGIRQFHPPVAIVFTKSDLHPDVEADPGAFARQYMRQTCEYLRQHASQYRFFAISSTGPLDNETAPPSSLSPSRVYDPLLWCAHAHDRRRNTIWAIAAGTMLLLLALAYGGLYLSNQREIERVDRERTHANAEQLFSLYGQARGFDGLSRFLLTHPRRRLAAVNAVVHAADGDLKSELEPHCDAANDLRTVQDYEAAGTLVRLFVGRYKATEPGKRWQDWLSNQRKKLAWQEVAEMKTLAKDADKAALLTRHGKYLVVATPETDVEVKKIMDEVLPLALLRQEVTALRLEVTALRRESRTRRVDQVRERCRRAEEMLDNHPVPESHPLVQYLRLVRRIHDGLHQDRPAALLIKIESASSNPIKWVIKVDGQEVAAADYTSVLAVPGISNWFGTSTTVQLNLIDLVHRPQKPMDVCILEDILGPWDGCATLSGDGKLHELVERGELDLSTNARSPTLYLLKCYDEADRARGLLRDLRRMEELEDVIFRQSE